MSNKIVITRHPALYSYLLEIGLIEDDTPYLQHAKSEDVKGKHVYGVIPMHLAAEAETFTSIPLDLAWEERGQELTLNRVREAAQRPITFRVVKCVTP